MTNFEAMTRSNIVEVKSKEEALSLLKDYTFDDACPEIIDDNRVQIYGYSWFSAESDEYNLEDATEEFLNRLAEIMLDSEILEIQEMGSEGLRFFSACKITVEAHRKAVFETFF